MKQFFILLFKYKNNILTKTFKIFNRGIIAKYNYESMQEDDNNNKEQTGIILFIYNTFSF